MVLKFLPKKLYTLIFNTNYKDRGTHNAVGFFSSQQDNTEEFLACDKGIVEPGQTLPDRMAFMVLATKQNIIGCLFPV